MATASYQPTAGPAGSYAPATDTRFAVDDAVLAAARAIAPIAREHAEETERTRRLARPVLEALRGAALFRLFTPRALGGLETDPVTLARAVEEIAMADSAAGWAMQAGNTGAWWASRMSAEAIAELFADGPDLLMAATFSPPHRAEEVPGGYRFTGRGPLASTIHDSPWVLMNGIVFDGEKPRMTPFGPEIVSLVMHTREVEIVDTWQSLGMRGTDSNDVAASGVFVPASRTFHIVPDPTPPAPFDGPLYRLPALLSVDVVVAPVALGIARNAIAELRDLATKKVALGSMKTLRDRGSVQSAVAEAEATLRSARAFFYDTVASAWECAVAGEPILLERKADLMLASAWAVRSAARATDLMHRAAGSTGIYARSRLERHLRDAMTVRHHGLLCESRLENVGQAYLGAELEFPMMAV